MAEVFLLTLNKVSILIIYIGLGYLLRRSKQLPEQAGQVLSLLCLLVFSPAYNFTNLSKNFTLAVLSEKLQILGAGVIFVLAFIFLGRFLGRILGKSEIEKASLSYGFAFANFAFFGYPVVEGVFGSAMLGDFIVFLIPFTIATNTYGYLLFQKDKSVSVFRMLAKPVVFALGLGMIFGLANLQLPSVVTSVLSGAASCMSPCSMLLAGFMLGKYTPKKLLSGKRPYLLSLIRMVALPVGVTLVLYLLGLQGKYFFLPCMFSCLPLPLTLVIFLESQGYEEEATDNAKLCFISILLSLVVLPCTFSILTWLCGDML